MEAILTSIKNKEIPANPAVVISNKPDARGLKIAERMGIRTAVIDSNLGKSRQEYDRMVTTELARNGVTPRNGLVCLAGFMRILGPEFIKKYKNKIINIHPALLPAFPGLGAQRQALDYGVKYSGCTVHFVDSGVDTGPIILQKTVQVKKGDTEKTLSKRILEKEHVAYPEAVRLFAQKRIRLAGRRTIIR